MEVFELGRGAKLVSNTYWHQFVLKFDFQNQQKPFIAIEIGKDAELLRKNLSLMDIQNQKWRELLEQSKSVELIKSYALHPNRTKNNWRIISQKQKEFNGKWITSKEVEVLNYNSNHGNWIDSRDIPGKFKFELDLENDAIKNCHILIPVEYRSGGPGYYSIYYGRFELTLKHILIWQNDTFPTRIKYKWEDAILELELFNKIIHFIRA